MSNNESSANAADMSRHRRGSLSSTTFSNLFPRSNSVSTGTPVFPGPPGPGPITSAAMNDQNRRRRLSLSTAAAMGLSGSSPTSASGSGPSLFGVRRSSISTNSSMSDAAVDESAIEEDDGAPGGSRISPRSTPFARRTSFGAQAMRNLRGPNGGSIGASPNDQGYNWPEQFRSRAESSVASGSRASFSFASGMNNSPPRAGGAFPVHGFGSAGGGVGVGPVRHDRSQSVSDVPAPVVSAAPQPPRQRRPSRPKPDQFQERILKGDFYMD